VATLSGDSLATRDRSNRSISSLGGIRQMGSFVEGWTNRNSVLSIGRPKDKASSKLPSVRWTLISSIEAHCEFDQS